MKIFLMVVGFIMLVAIGAVADNNPIQPGTDYNAYVSKSGATVLRVRKGSAGLIARGKPVCMVNYSSASQFTVELADADDRSKGPAIGIMDTVTTNSLTGDCVIGGTVANIDTSAGNVGSVFYLGTTAGQLKATAPATSGAKTQPCAIILRKDAKYGIILVVPAGRWDARTFKGYSTS